MTRPHGPTRRQALALGPAALLAAGALAGCTGEPSPDPTAAPSPAPVDPDEALRSAAADRELVLLRAYDAELAALPSLSARLRPLRAHHVEHLAALGTDAPDDPSAEPTPERGGAASPAATEAPPTVPAAADVAAALARLVAAERAAGQGHGQDCLLASRELAGVLGSLSASELSHEVALG